MSYFYLSVMRRIIRTAAVLIILTCANVYGFQLINVNNGISNNRKISLDYHNKQTKLNLYDYKPNYRSYDDDFETEIDIDNEIESDIEETNRNQMKLKTDFNKLVTIVEADATIIQQFFRVLPVISIFISLVGIAFQVFVLYPWHEELSYEFKTLEQAIIRLDERIEDSKKSKDFVKLDRPTDKYASNPDSKSAGPIISTVVPFQELRELKEKLNKF